MELLIDRHHGIYIPQLFVQQYRSAILAESAHKEDLDIVEEGPDNELYWEAWDNIEQRIVLIGSGGGRFTLYQNEDLWAVEEDEEIPEN